jgi:hypothetical protein
VVSDEAAPLVTDDELELGLAPRFRPFLDDAGYPLAGNVIMGKNGPARRRNAEASTERATPGCSAPSPSRSCGTTTRRTLLAPSKPPSSA